MSSAEHSTRFSALPQSWRDAAFQASEAVLLETSMPSEAERHSYLFTGATKILTARVAEDIPTLFAAIESALAAGSYVAGWFAYEAAAGFFDRHSFRDTEPLAVLGVFPAPQVFDHAQAPVKETEPAGASLPIAPMMQMERPAYIAAVEQIQQWIAAGETYQVNFTSSMIAPYRGSASPAYDALRVQQPCSYAAVVRLEPSQSILSFSPELFFRVDSDGTITTKPMKGTAKRGLTIGEEAANVEALRSDEKNRAEHVMIVDLLRNDLGRICEMGSVRVEELFAVEPYNTLLQMTSTVRGQLPQSFLWFDVFRSLFPCGSITGAPKHHTIELIGRVETEARGIYTGAIGYFAPDRTACFNVAIRTAVLEKHQLTLGVGGGIVADSKPETEYAECLLKAGFLQRAGEPFSLIETMLWERGACALLDRHISRVLASAEALGIPVEAQQLYELLSEESVHWQWPQRVRLAVDPHGEPSVSVMDAPVWSDGLRLRLATTRTQSNGPHLRHKTTFRPEYDHELQSAKDAGYDEAIFLNERIEVTEGCISTLLLCLDGRWCTPALAAGVLPGVYRAHLLNRGIVEERTLTMRDLERAEFVAICNAVRGIGYVTSLARSDAPDLTWPACVGADRLLA